MYNTSNEYKKILNSDEQRYSSYIELEDGTQITSNNDLSALKIADTIGSNLIGNFSPKIANISILNNKKYNLTDKKFKLYVGLYLDDTNIEYIPQGTFIVSKPTENNKASKEITLEAKDLSYLFDKEYERTKFDKLFPCKIKTWTSAICEEIGVPFASGDFPNANVVLEFQPYTEDGATNRNVIAKIAESCASFAKVGRDDKVYFKQLNSLGTKKILTVSQVNQMLVKDVNNLFVCQLGTKINKKITLKNLFEQKKDDLLYGPVNAIVASRIVADDGTTTEDVYARDEESIETDGLCEYKIKENWVIDNDRETFIKGILESMKGTTFNTGKIEIVSDPAIDVGDYIEVSDVDSDTSFIMLVMDNELDATTYTSSIESSMPSKTQTDYQSATISKKDKIRKTELKVNKLDGKITSIIEEQDEQSQKLTQVEQTVDGITQSVSQNTTDIHNNYQEIIQKLDDVPNKEDIVSLKNEVETIQTSTEYAINIAEEIQVNGVSKVRTETGYTFDDDGLTIEKTNAKTKSTLNETGLEVKDSTGSEDEVLLKAGYDEETGETIVKSKNMTVEKYLTVGKNSRIEDYDDEILGTGTGIFFVG